MKMERCKVLLRGSHLLWELYSKEDLSLFLNLVLNSEYHLNIASIVFKSTRSK